MKKAFYSSLLASGAATICYPKEASELFHKGWGAIKEKSTGIVTFLIHDYCPYFSYLQ